MELLKGDRNRILQVIVNLVSNAIKFTAKGYVNIGLSVSEIQQSPAYSPTPYSRCLEIVVEDTGVGMTQEEIDQLFKTRFYQAKSHIHYQGSSGLGLNISYKLVELMSGTLTVNSVYGKGSKFTVTVPCLAVTEEEKAQFIQSLNPTISAFKLENSLMKILVVDDNEINRKILVNMLSREGYKCETANDGEEAIAKYMNPSPRYDLIVMDIEMPKMNGYEVTKKIREYEKEQRKDHRIPIICVSGNSGEEFKSRVMREGFDDCVPKPYDKMIMLQKVHDLLNPSTFLPNFKKRTFDQIQSDGGNQTSQLPPPKKPHTN